MTELTKEENEIVDAIKLFGGTVTGLKLKRFRFTVKVTIAFGLVLASLLTIIIWIYLVVIPRIDHNSKTVKSVQCSLYRLVLTSGYHPESRVDPTKSDQEQKENLAVYNLQYKTIIFDNNRLGCLEAQGPTKYITNPDEATSTTTTTLPTLTTPAT